jgi:hypothetical protein
MAYDIGSIQEFRSLAEVVARVVTVKVKKVSIQGNVREGPEGVPGNGRL